MGHSAPGVSRNEMLRMNIFWNGTVSCRWHSGQHPRMKLFMYLKVLKLMTKDNRTLLTVKQVVGSSVLLKQSFLSFLKLQ